MDPPGDYGLEISRPAEHILIYPITFGDSRFDGDRREAHLLHQKPEQQVAKLERLGAAVQALAKGDDRGVADYAAKRLQVG